MEILLELGPIVFFLALAIIVINLVIQPLLKFFRPKKMETPVKEEKQEDPKTPDAQIRLVHPTEEQTRKPLSSRIKKGPRRNNTNLAFDYDYYPQLPQLTLVKDKNPRLRLTTWKEWWMNPLILAVLVAIFTTLIAGSVQLPYINQFMEASQEFEIKRMIFSFFTFTAGLLTITGILFAQLAKNQLYIWNSFETHMHRHHKR